MSGGRLDVMSPRPRKDGKTFWFKIGAAFPRDGGGFTLTLDALPLTDADGRCSLLLAEPRDADGHQDRQDRAGGYERDYR